jgi:uncharacterized protein (TIGR01777 family)
MMTKPKIVIAGGSGFFGNHLVEYFKNTYQVIVLTRGKSFSENSVKYEHWNAETKGDWVEVLNGAQVLINLTGKSINCRFTAENKKNLLSSRINATNVLAAAIESIENPPKIWFNASAGAMYKVKDKPNTEEEKEYDDSFLAKMALAWEKAFFEKNLPQTKRVAMRISLILGTDGGVFPVWKKITNLLMGGKAGNGRQKVAWIHVEDAISAVDFIIKNNLEGVFNFSTNQPLSNKELMKTLRSQMNIPFGLPAPEFSIRLGSMFLQTEPSLLLDSVNFIPKKLNEKGFQFKYNQISLALNNLIKNG